MACNSCRKGVNMLADGRIGPVPTTFSEEYGIVEGPLRTFRSLGLCNLAALVDPSNAFAVFAFSL
jgi:hypothetical protein